MPNFAGNGKFNKGAFDSMMQNNLKKAKTKERMKAKLDDNKKNNDQRDDNLSKSELDKVNQNLQEIMKQLNLDNIPDIMEQINSQNSQNSSKSKKKKGKPAKKK
jgi:endonuclease IV